MKKLSKKIISFTLVLTVLFCLSIPVFAADVKEEYICDLRLIYADDYNEAKAALVGTDFEGYKVYNYNLNDDTGKTGVWLIYKTTTDIEDAITDISVMQMNGGYKEGNYQAMIEASFAEYEAMGENYLTAIDYFIDAYDEGDFLANLAYRQLNFYTSITDESLGIEIPDFDGELLGDVFYNGISSSELATIFMEGNSYALANIRSLLAMGVSYNEDGKHYLEKVAEAVKLFEEDEDALEDHDYYDDFDDLALVIASSIKIYKEQFKELATYEDELNYYDKETTELELKYVDIKSIADRFRDVEYLDGKTLYDFCMSYKYDEDDFTPIYPLVYALNEGQIAMVRVAHFGDVVRYSMSDYPEEELIKEVERLEEIYSVYPFNVYTGVDRSIYYGSFALTTDAYRSDAYTGEGLLSHLFEANGDILLGALNTGAGSVFFGAWAIARTKDAIDAKMTVASAKELATSLGNMKSTYMEVITENVQLMPASDWGLGAYGQTFGDAVNTLCQKLNYDALLSMGGPDALSTKLGFVLDNSKLKNSLSQDQINTLQNIDYTFRSAQREAGSSIQDAQNVADDVIASSSVSKLSLFGTGVLYVASAALMLYTAYTLGHTVWNYYHTDYDDIPVALVDLIETVDGDRYIKYDAVFNAETNKDGVYETADLNAFEGQRWNALYYTKSYEAGKPLLADAFNVSPSNSTPKDGYAPIHRFGEVVCYNLNKYTYGITPGIYLSVKQSKNDKSAVAEVPPIVGSMIGAGYLFLACGGGLALGVGGTLAVGGILKRKKTASGASEAASEGSDES